MYIFGYFWEWMVLANSLVIVIFNRCMQTPPNYNYSVVKQGHVSGWQSAVISPGLYRCWRETKPGRMTRAVSASVKQPRPPSCRGHAGALFPANRDQSGPKGCHDALPQISCKYVQPVPARVEEPVSLVMQSSSGGDTRSLPFPNMS